MVIFKQQVTNEQLEKKLDDNNLVILDVRETEEYSSEHIPGAVLIPLGQLEERCNELDDEADIYCICHSGGRSNAACHILTEKGLNLFTMSFRVCLHGPVT